MEKKFNRERKMIGDEMRKVNALYHNAMEKLKKVAAKNKQLRRATGSSEQLKQIKARVDIHKDWKFASLIFIAN